MSKRAKEITWEKVKNQKPCLRGECSVNYINGKAYFRYENYIIDADKVFNHFPKEE